MDDDLIVKAAKKILLDEDSPDVLASGFIRELSFEMSANNVNFGSQTYQSPSRPTVKLDIVFDCSDDQARRLKKKFSKHSFRVILVDGDDNG